MFKKFICLFSVLCLLFSLAACNEPAETEPPESKEINYEVMYSVNYGSTYARVVTVQGSNIAGDIVIADSYNGLPVTTIDADAFSGLINITSITLPDTITTIGQYAFNGCKGLKEINIPAGVQYMGQKAFANCPNLVITLEAKEFPDDTWADDWNDGCKELVLGTKELPDFSASNNNNASNNNTNNNTNNNNGSTSQYSQGLEFVYYSQGYNGGYAVKSVGTCKDENIVIPPTYKGFNDREALPIVAINDNAFKNATFLKSIVIPDSVHSIGKNVFSGCSNLESITTPYVGEVLGELFGTSAFDGAEKISQHTMTGYNASLKMIDYYIPTSLRTVNLTKYDYCYGMFSGCYFLTSVSIGYSNIEHPNLGAYAFYGCKGLTQLTLTNKLESIGDYAFYNCENLESITFANDASYNKLTQIGDSAFKNCKKLTSITIGDLVERIEDEAFAGCESLTRLTIPARTKYVGYEIVDSDCKALTSITVLASSSNRNNWDDHWNGTTVNPYYS